MLVPVYKHTSSVVFQSEMNLTLINSQLEWWSIKHFFMMNDWCFSLLGSKTKLVKALEALERGCRKKTADPGECGRGLREKRRPAQFSPACSEEDEASNVQ